MDIGIDIGAPGGAQVPGCCRVKDLLVGLDPVASAIGTRGQDTSQLVEVLSMALGPPLRFLDRHTCVPRLHHRAEQSMLPQRK